MAEIRFTSLRISLMVEEEARISFIFKRASFLKEGLFNSLETREC